MRLIDADALMNAMYHRAFETDGDTMWQSGCWVRYKAIEQVVKEQPSVDAEPVTHCKDCLFGHRHDEVINGYEDTWIECINPDGMNRDVSINGYCSAGVRKND